MFMSEANHDIITQETQGKIYINLFMTFAPTTCTHAYTCYITW